MVYYQLVIPIYTLKQPRAVFSLLKMVLRGASGWVQNSGSLFFQGQEWWMPKGRKNIWNRHLDYDVLKLRWINLPTRKNNKINLPIRQNHPPLWEATAASVPRFHRSVAVRPGTFDQFDTKTFFFCKKRLYVWQGWLSCFYTEELYVTM